MKIFSINEPFFQRIKFYIPKKENLIFQDIYPFDIFSNIFQDIDQNLIKRDYPYLYYTSEDIKEKLPVIWKGKKYLKPNKNLYIFLIQPFELNDKVFSQFNFSNTQKISIKVRFQSDYGLFLRDFDYIDKSISILLLNSQTEYHQLSKYTAHQLIHYFQWNTGRSLYSISKEIQSSEQDINDIKQILKIEDITKILNKYQLVTYAQKIYYQILDISNKEYNGKIKYYLNNLFAFLDEKPVSFKNFYQTIIQKMNQVKFPYNMNFLVPLLLFKYYRFGFYSIKNHIYGYLNNNIRKGDIK